MFSKQQIRSCNLRPFQEAQYDFSIDFDDTQKLSETINYFFSNGILGSTINTEYNIKMLEEIFDYNTIQTDNIKDLEQFESIQKRIMHTIDDLKDYLELLKEQKNDGEFFSLQEITSLKIVAEDQFEETLRFERAFKKYQEQVLEFVLEQVEKRYAEKKSLLDVKALSIQTSMRLIAHEIDSIGLDVPFNYFSSGKPCDKVPFHGSKTRSSIASQIKGTFDLLVRGKLPENSGPYLIERKDKEGEF